MALPNVLRTCAPKDSSNHHVPVAAIGYRVSNNTSNVSNDLRTVNILEQIFKLFRFACAHMLNCVVHLGEKLSKHPSLGQPFF
jgi:hypothetical protein